MHAFGVSVGDLVARQVPSLVWGSARDDASSELVLTHPTHDLVVFPLAAVAKIWGTAPVGWVGQYVREASSGAAATLAAAAQPTDH